MVNTVSENVPMAYVVPSINEANVVETNRTPAKPNKLKRKSRLEKGLLLAVLLLLLLVLALTVALGIYRHRYKKKLDETHYCYTDICIERADSLMKSLNKSVDPCHDFYEFTCGNWHKYYPMGNADSSKSWFSIVGEKLQRSVTEMLNENGSPSDITTVKKMRTCYDSCQDTDTVNKLGLAPMRKVLQELSLSQEVPLPGITTDFQFSRTLGKIHNILNLNPFFKVSGVPNGNITSLLFSSLRWNMKRSGIVSRTKPKRRMARLTSKQHLKVVLKYVSDVIHYIGNWNVSKGQGLSEEKADEVAVKIQLAVSKLRIVAIQLNFTEPDDSTVAALQELFNKQSASLTSKLNMREYMDALLAGVNMTVDYEKDVIGLADEPYFKSMGTTLASVEPETLHRFLWWKVVEHLIPYTNSDLRNIATTYTNDLRGYPLQESRETTCTLEIVEQMPAAVIYTMSKYNPMTETFNKVRLMLDDIRESFREIIRGIRWMDKKTKDATIEKADAMKFTVGYPNWTRNADFVNDNHKEIEVNEGEYLLNYVNLMTSKTKKSLEATKPSEWEDMNPLEVNAFYDPSKNAIEIKSTILESPLYKPSDIDLLNYAAIGAILGHELTHGFDNDGKNYDKDGNNKPWWSSEMISTYNKKVECFVNQYGSYKLYGKLPVNGSLTVGENIADNGGLRETLFAYRRRVRRRGKEPKLPGLGHYSTEQLFFLVYANTWCGSDTPEYSLEILKDLHSPREFRVLGTLSNMPEFSQAWDCPAGSSMNPSTKCLIW